MAVELIILQHVACESIGSIQESLNARNIVARFVRIFNEEPVPANIGTAAGLIIMGGPMSVYDYNRFPHLRQEMALIETALKKNRPVLGVCLGCQLLAAVVGGNVKPSGSQEIGWHSVELTEKAVLDPLWIDIPSRFTAFHWHGDIFDMPAQADLLAASQKTAHQAFRWGANAYGLLFHLEVTKEIIHRMATTFSEDLAKESLDGTQLMEQTGIHLPALQNVARPVFARWLDLLTEC